MNIVLKIKKNFLNLYQTKFILFFISIPFILHQFYYIRLGGVTWDETLDIYGSGKNIEKFKLFIANEEIIEPSTLVAQYFGQLIKLPIYIISQSEGAVNLFSKIFETIFQDESSYIESFFNLRHYLLNIYVFFSIFIIFNLLNKIIHESKISLLIIFFIFWNPIFIGHAMFNLSDIPMAIQIFIASLTYIYLILHQEPHRKNFFVVGIFFGLALLTRISAAAFLLPLGLYFLIVKRKEKKFIHLIFNHFYILISAFIVLVLGSPGAFIDPVHYINGLINAQFTGQEFNGYFPMNGKMLFSLDWNPEYLLNLFLYKLPIVILIFTLLGFSKLRQIKSHLFRYSFLFILYTYIAHEIFRPSVFNYFRHYIFLIPFFCVISGFAFHSLIENKKQNFQLISFIAILFYFVFTQFGLEQYKYVYVNEFVDEDLIGIECSESYELNGCGYWQTDYYGFSGKQTIEIVENLNIENVYICQPGHSYSLYIESNDYWKINNGNPDFDDYAFWDQYIYLYNIDHFNEFLEINPKGYFYALAIHSPGYKTCSLERVSTDIFDIDCKIEEVVTTKLRGTSINLNYIHYCEYTT